MRQLFVVLLLLMFVSTSVFAEGLGVYAALQQANSHTRTRTRTITSQVDISFLSSHDVGDDGVSDWLGPLLFGVGGTGLAVFGTALVILPGASPETTDLFPAFLVPGIIVGLSGFIVFLESLFS